jgi:hypothetical protein
MEWGWIFLCDLCVLLWFIKTEDERGINRERAQGSQRGNGGGFFFVIYAFFCGSSKQRMRDGLTAKERKDRREGQGELWMM